MKSIKQIIFLFFIIFFVNLNFLSAISIEENEYYIKAQELYNQAIEEYNKGEYDNGYELSEQAKEYLIKANQDILIQLFLLRLQNSKEIANNKLNELYDLEADTNKNVEEPFNKALNLFEEGEKAYKLGNEKNEYPDKADLYQTAIDNFEESIMYSNQVLNELSPDKDYRTAKNLLEKAVAMRDQLVRDNILSENSTDDRNISELIDSSKEAFLDKLYKESIEESKEAIALMDKIYKELGSSDLALMYEAFILLNKARNELKDAREFIDQEKNLDKLNEAENIINEAKIYYDENKYIDSIAKSQSALDLLSTINYDYVFPKYYKVQLIPNRRDCFWRIAEKNFVYGNGFKWPELYRANKNKLKFPNNPHLIYPWKIIEIPSIKGEKREGLYDPKKKYPKFNSNKNYNIK